MAGRILPRVIIDYTNDDEFIDNSMESVRTAMEFEDMMPASMRGEYRRGQSPPIRTRGPRGAFTP